MQRIYLLESKDYFIDEQGRDVQVADGGILPIVYTARKSAMRDALKAVETYKAKFGYTLSHAATFDQGDVNDCLYSATLLDSNQKDRHVIRVYKSLTWD